MRKPLASLLLTTTIFLVACAGSPEGDDPSSRSGPTTQGGQGEQERQGSSEAAPDFSFQTFEGDEFRLDEQRGTPVVLNFWESW